jgi:hypothetical protein
MKTEGRSIGRRKGKGGRERRVRGNDGGVYMIKVHCMHVWKCHNETP